MSKKKSKPSNAARHGAEESVLETKENWPKINICAEFKINFLRKPDHPDKGEWYRLDVPTSYQNMADVRFGYFEGVGAVQLYDFPVSPKALEYMNSPTDPMLVFLSFPPDYESTHQSICLELNSSVRRVLEYVKFFLGRYEISDEVATEISTFTWAMDRNSHDYRNCPGKISGKIGANFQQELNYDVRLKLQQGIDRNIQPFFAMRHIYRAIQEKNPKFKWIDATIAAELAIKEALIRKEPKLAALIEHVPSPPLTKLYGELMEAYLGQRSNFCKTLDNGVRIRNKLVHQPLEHGVTESEAEDYAGQVLNAINELYGILYPDWEIAVDVAKVRHLFHF